MGKRKTVGIGENIVLKIYNNWNADTLDKEIFMIRDVLGALMLMEREDSTLVYIQNYNGTQEEKEESIKYVLSLFNDKENAVILIQAHVSKVEFPEEKYYDPYDGDEKYIKNSIKAGKKPIEFDKIIERESKLLESIGFIDINDFVQYEFSKAYLYGNSLGKELANFINNMKS